MCISTDIAKFGISMPSSERGKKRECSLLLCGLSPVRLLRGFFGKLCLLLWQADCNIHQMHVYISICSISSPFNVSLKILLQSFQIVTRFQCALLTLSLPHPHGLLLADAYTSRAMPGGAILSSTAYPVSVCPFILSLFVLYFTSHTTLLPPPP